MILRTPEELKQQLAGGTTLVLDVREPWEHAICNIGGKHVVMHEIPVAKLDFTPGQEVCVVCKSGKRAEAVANLLATQYPEVNFAILDGGISAWYATFDPTFEMY